MPAVHQRYAQTDGETNRQTVTTATTRFAEIGKTTFHHYKIPTSPRQYRELLTTMCNGKLEFCNGEN